MKNLKTISISLQFNGTEKLGLVDSSLFIPCASQVNPCLNAKDLIYEIFYKIPEELITVDPANTYIEAGTVENADCIFNSTTGNINTLNAVKTGVKLEGSYTKVNAESLLQAITKGASNITSGRLEVILLIIPC